MLLRKIVGVYCELTRRTWTLCVSTVHLVQSYKIRSFALLVFYCIVLYCIVLYCIQGRIVVSYRHFILCVSCNVVVLTCLVMCGGVCVSFVMCGCVCMCGFCNVGVCVCVGFVMCGCLYVWVL